jgi:hypothetical protein
MSHSENYFGGIYGGIFQIKKGNGVISRVLKLIM